MKKWFIKKYESGFFGVLASIFFILVIINIIIALLFYYCGSESVKDTGTAVFGLMAGIFAIFSMISMIIDSTISISSR